MLKGNRRMYYNNGCELDIKNKFLYAKLDAI